MNFTDAFNLIHTKRFHSIGYDKGNNDFVIFYPPNGVPDGVTPLFFFTSKLIPLNDNAKTILDAFKHEQIQMFKQQ